MLILLPFLCSKVNFRFATFATFATFCSENSEKTDVFSKSSHLQNFEIFRFLCYSALFRLPKAPQVLAAFGTKLLPRQHPDRTSRAAYDLMAPVIFHPLLLFFPIVGKSNALSRHRLARPTCKFSAVRFDVYNFCSLYIRVLSLVFHTSSFASPSSASMMVGNCLIISWQIAYPLCTSILSVIG